MQVFREIFYFAKWFPPLTQHTSIISRLAHPVKEAHTNRKAPRSAPGCLMGYFVKYCRIEPL